MREKAKPTKVLPRTAFPLRFNAIRSYGDEPFEVIRATLTLLSLCDYIISIEREIVI